VITKYNKSQLNKIIGKNIQRERIARDMTVNEICEIIGTTASHIRLIESGNRGTTSHTLLKISKLFSMPIDRFFIPPDMRNFKEEDNPSPADVKRKKIRALLEIADTSTLDFITSVIQGVNIYTNDRKSDA